MLAKQLAAVATSLLAVGTIVAVVIGIQMANSSNSRDGSPDDGTPHAGAISVTSPTSDSTWTAGDSQTISWSSDGTVGSYVRLEYDYSYYGTSSAKVISSSTLNDGTFVWDIPADTAARTNYLVRITSTSYSDIYDDSELFEIRATQSEASITITSPTSSSVWAAGSTNEIAWTYSGEIGSSVKIEYDYSYYSSPVLIASDTSNDGLYSWTVPSGVTPKSNYFIRVSSAGNPDIFDDSQMFEISESGSITVTSPSSYSSWQTGNSYYIEWTSAGAVGSYVKIEIDYSSYYSYSAQTITSSTSNDGMYLWSIQDTTTPRDNYLIRVSSASDPQIYDDSPLFEIRVPLVPPSLYTPSNGGLLTDTTPTFDWEAVTGAEKYTIEIDDSSYFYSPAVSTVVTYSIFTPSFELDSGTPYYWRVSSGSADSWSDWSETWSFTIGTSSFHMSYAWSYGGYSWTMTLDVPGSIYYYYKGLPRTSDYDTLVTEIDSTIVNIASLFKEKADSRGYSSYELVSFVMAFVQSLPYTSDSETTGYDEYARYPIETLVDNGGDCEDTAILLAAIVQASPINIDAVLFLLPYDNPTHMATGIWGTGLSGSYVTYGGRDYYYCETTGDGFSIGQLPSAFEGVSVRVVPV